MVTLAIEELLHQKFTEPEFSNFFIVEVKLAKNNKLEVFVESDDAVTLAHCQKLSRYLEQHLEEKKWLGEQYTLEVSSPGLSRPLQSYRQYVKNIGRQVVVTLTDQSTYTGILQAANEQEIQVATTQKVKEGKKNIVKEALQTIPYTAIQKTIIKISFS